MPTPDRNALRTVSDIAVGRLEGIIGQVDVLRKSKIDANSV